jgi:hypothetical protein
MGFVVVHWCVSPTLRTQHPQESIQFAAVLCEISVGNHTQRSAFKDLAPWPHAPPNPLSPYVLGITAATNFYRTLVMKIERNAGHNEAREALVLSVAGVTAIMLIANLLLLILY